MNLGELFPEEKLARLVHECTTSQRTDPQWSKKLLRETVKIWQEILAPGYPFGNIEFQAACLGFFDPDLPSPLYISSLTPPRALIACRLGLGMTREEIAEDTGYAVRQVNERLTTIRSAWQLPKYSRTKLLAIRAAQGGYAPPPLLHPRVLRATWHDLPGETRRLLINKSRGRHEPNLDPQLLQPLGIRAWSALPLVVSVVYPPFFEEARALEQGADPFIPPQDNKLLGMIISGWIPKQIGFFYGTKEEEVRMREERLMRRFGVETRLELTYRALLHRTLQEGAHYP